MKTLAFYRLTAFVFILTLLFVPSLYSQWESDLRLTFNNAASLTSYNNAHCIATGPGGLLHLVWYDNREGNNKIFYKRSTDDGITWSPDERLIDERGIGVRPSIAATDTVVHVVWMDDRNSNWEIYYKHSTDRGLTWSPDTRLTNDPNVSEYPSIAVSGTSVHVVWDDYRDDPQGEIYYKRSTDNGLTWDTVDNRLTRASGYSLVPSVSVTNSFVHVVWHDYRDNNFEIYYKRSTNGGLTWGADTRLTFTPFSSGNPSISAQDTNVQLVFGSFRTGTWYIYHKQSEDTGLTWSPDKLISWDSLFANDCQYPSLSVSGKNVHVVWMEYWGGRSGNQEIEYDHSTDGGVTWGWDTRLTNDTMLSENPFISVVDSVVHVVWQDNRDGNYEIYYKRNPTGNSGVEGNGIPSPVSLPPFHVSPNPFTSFSRIPGHETERFALYDIAGRRVGTYQGNRIGGDVAPGVYFLRREGDSEKPLRIVKVR
jgi:hypothetical protein